MECRLFLILPLLLLLATWEDLTKFGIDIDHADQDLVEALIAIVLVDRAKPTNYELTRLLGQNGKRQVFRGHFSENRINPFKYNIDSFDSLYIQNQIIQHPRIYRKCDPKIGKSNPKIVINRIR
jgi:hypothetical protein